jgi:FKBP-type peptidyl-prolyl cis-trans isomerase FklB
MKFGTLISAIGVASMTLMGCQKEDTSAASRVLTTQKDKVSYGIGLDIGKSLKQQTLGDGDIDLGKLRAGIEDVLSGAKPVLSDSQLRETMMAFQKDMTTRHDSLNRVKGEANLKAGTEFLAKNGKEEGVVTLPSGLQYKVLTQGNGAKPDSTSTVTVNYAGTLLDGTEFDSSIKRGQPATFPVAGVIKGWTEVLQLMPTGSKWKVFIPSALAYGPNGAGAQIGPNSTLIFEVDLISIAEPPKAEAPAAAMPKHK